MKRNGWGGPNFNFSYMNLYKIKNNHTKKKNELFLRRLYHPADEDAFYILQEMQLKYGVPTIRQPKS